MFPKLTIDKPFTEIPDDVLESDLLLNLYKVGHSSYDHIFITIKLATVEELKQMLDNIDIIKEEMEKQLLLKS